MNKIPRNPSWCSYCKKNDCTYHQGSNGEKVFYDGFDAYNPSDWVLQVVGTFHRAWDGDDYMITGYDPRHGFWIKNIYTGAERNISERAIHRTYHPIHEYNHMYAKCALTWF